MKGAVLTGLKRNDGDWATDTDKKVQDLLHEAHEDLRVEKHRDFLQEESHLLISTYRQGWLLAATMVMLLESRCIIRADFPPHFFTFFIAHFGNEYPGLSEIV